MRNKVVVQNRFRWYGAQLDEMVVESIERTSAHVRDELRALAPVGDGTSGVQPGHFRDTFRLARVRRHSKGFEGGVVTEDPTAIWLRWGTLGRRKKKLKAKTLARRATASGAARFAKVAGRRGVKPHTFFSRAARAGRERMIAELKRAAPK